MLICDASNDCPDVSEDVECPVCHELQFRCPKSNVCIDNDKVCDGNVDCLWDEEDENDCGKKFVIVDNDKNLKKQD